MGPHGILIGATGSGKSELLRTLVLGLAARNEPDELAFLLTDFKGGATFAELGELPHVAGTITNLEADPTLIDRMHDALFGELERRQRVLRAAGIDRADAYRALRQVDPRDLPEPLPALLVIVDEFGELLSRRPEFVDLFASIGRTGRSLGVHLLLAGQRLDEGRVRAIDGHLRYRICLRTFTAEESMAVVGSRVAVDLPPIPGVGYLGVDGRLRRFTGATVSGPYRTDSSDTARVRNFAVGGSDSTTAEPAPPTEHSEMSHLIGRLVDPGRRVRSVWLEPLPQHVQLPGLLEHDQGLETRPLAVPIGLRDLPRIQRQDVAVLDFGGTTGNLAVVGGPRTGKSTLLASVLASAALTRPPCDVQFYVIDLGGGTLHALADLPHVGAVFGRADREEIVRLVRQMGDIVARRIEEFRRHRLRDAAAFHAARSAGWIESTHGEVFLVIDDWARFVQEQPDDVVEAVVALVGSGLHYGVHVLVSSGRWQDFRLGMKDAIGGRFELRLPDAFDSEIDRHAAAALPDLPGRGLDHLGNQVQVATVEPDDLVGVVAERWEGVAGAPQIRLLPDRVELADLAPTGEGLVLGIDERTLEVWSIDLFGDEPHLVVLGDGPCGKSNLLRALAARVNACPDSVQIAAVDPRRRVVDAIPDDLLLGAATSADTAAALSIRLRTELERRAATVESGADWSRLVLLVDDYDQIAGVSGTPLASLVDQVARGSDLGFHLVLTRRVSGFGRAAFDPLLTRLREIGCQGLLMNGDPHEGPLLGGTATAALPVGRGIHVSRRGTVMVQTAHATELGWTGLRRVV